MTFVLSCELVHSGASVAVIDAGLAANAAGLIEAQAEALGRDIPSRRVRSRGNTAIQTNTAERIIAAITEPELPLLAAGLVERFAYRDIFDFAATLEELDGTTTSGIPAARKNAYEVAGAVVEAVQETNKQEALR